MKSIFLALSASVFLSGCLATVGVTVPVHPRPVYVHPQPVYVQPAPIYVHPYHRGYGHGHHKGHGRHH